MVEAHGGDVYVRHCDLLAGNQENAEGCREGRRRPDANHLIVIRDRNRVEATSSGLPREVPRQERAVARSGVDVQVDGQSKHTGCVGRWGRVHRRPRLARRRRQHASGDKNGARHTDAPDPGH